uniref:Uncharacterized protein n=1 Tax=Anguilla anguilla TaxID=7936 RepID=A0A0E9QA77_ANGAN
MFHILGHYKQLRKKLFKNIYISQRWGHNDEEQRACDFEVRCPELHILKIYFTMNTKFLLWAWF